MKKAESEFLRKSKAPKKVRAKNSKQAKRNFKAHERRKRIGRRTQKPSQRKRKGFQTEKKCPKTKMSKT